MIYHLIQKLVFIVPVILLIGCTARIVHPGTIEKRVIIGGYPHYDVWPSYSFYYENWPVYHHQKYFQHHHHKFHYKHKYHKHGKHFHHKKHK